MMKPKKTEYDWSYLDNYEPMPGGHRWNKKEIRDRVMALAKEKSIFSRVDLIQAHMGEHHSEAWQAAINELIKEGKLFPEWPIGEKSYLLTDRNRYSMNPDPLPKED